MRATVQEYFHREKHITTTDGVDDFPGGGVLYYYECRRRSSFVKCVRRIVLRVYAWADALVQKIYVIFVVLLTPYMMVWTLWWTGGGGLLYDLTPIIQKYQEATRPEWRIRAGVLSCGLVLEFCAMSLRKSPCGRSRLTATSSIPPLATAMSNREGEIRQW